MKEALVDVSVLLVFFTRHEQFQKVFEQVRKARPSRLFLYQDGPRAGRDDDIINIEKCRAIADQVDWECEVHRLYQEKNMGCDPSGYLAQTWAFSYTEKCIVIEDDDIPSVSFFSFCKELLDKYENDQRVMLITGLNVDAITEYCPYDYFFTSTTFTVGCWASWRRVINTWDEEYAVLDEEYTRKLINGKIKKNNFANDFMNSCFVHKKSKIPHFETIMILNQYLNSGLTIVPKKNMVLNVGLTGDATHTQSELDTLPKGYRKLFMLETYEIQTDLKHPKYVIEDYTYQDRSYKVYGWNSTFIKIYRTLESFVYKILKGNKKKAFYELGVKISNYLKRKKEYEY
nr:hypothetical protein [uncultured Mediterraneibacter sp.]